MLNKAQTQQVQNQLDDIVNGRLSLTLEIRTDDGSCIGELRPLTRAHLADDDVIDRITRWRNENMGNFLTQFTATPGRTRHWLSNVVFKARGQLLFLVVVDGQVIGHLGFKNLTQDDVLLDNAMRGERVGHPRLFVQASKALNEWLFEEAGVHTIYGYVMTNNATAVMMNKQVGFEGWTRYPLLKRTDGADLRLEIGAEGKPSPDNLYCFKIVLTKKGPAPVNEIQKFTQEVQDNIAGLGKDRDLQALSRLWTRDVAKHKWSHNFSWMGRPAIQFPNDAWAMQELIWQVKPDLIIESGIAHGGSLICYASMLALLDVCESVETERPLDPRKTKRKVLGLDIDIRAHNRAEIEKHPMANWIQLIQGSSVAAETIAQVKNIAKGYRCILVSLDSNHTHEHVLAELKAYAPLVSEGSYCVVFDTIVEDMPAALSTDRPWGPGNNPKTAVWEYIKSNPEFEIDKSISDKLLITVAPEGFLKRVTR